MYQIYKAVIGKGDQMESDFEVFFDSIGTFLKYVNKLKGSYGKKICIRTNNLDRLQYADAKCNVVECIGKTVRETAIDENGYAEKHGQILAFTCKGDHGCHYETASYC